MAYRVLGPASAAMLAVATVLPLQFAVAQTPPDGENLFKQRCQACHQVVAGKPSPAGPNLYGVVDRKAASSPVPYDYSKALKDSGLTWTRDQLDAYLAAPTKKVPGTKMVIGLPLPGQRAAVLDYLARVK